MSQGPGPGLLIAAPPLVVSVWACGDAGPTCGPACGPVCWPVVGLIEGGWAHLSMVSLSRGAGRGYCRVAVLPVFHRAAADLPGLSPRVRGNRTIRILSFHVSGSPGFVFLNPLSLATDDCRSVLAVQGTLRRFAPWTAAGRSGRRGCLGGKGDVPASAGPEQRVRRSNARLEFDCRHGFDVRVTPPRQLGCTAARLRTAWAKPRAPRSGS